MHPRTAIPAGLLLGALLGGFVAVFAPADVQLRIREALRGSERGVIGVVVAAPLEPLVEWDIPVVENEHVLRYVDLFEQRQADRMALYLRRSGRYEGMIRAKLRERGMPEDLLYLSMIESGFNPNAYSKAHAAGLWQFIAPTGRIFGLRIDSYVDERRDPERSTDAALAYLSALHARFGSWYLAAAAYNCGENRVARIMREVTGSEHGTDDDFWRIRSRLPRETAEYVPLIVAAALVAKDPERYGLGDVERYLPPPIDSVAVPGGTELSVVARAAGVELSVLKGLNPQLVRSTTPPGAPYEVRMPAGTAERFVVGFEAARTAAAAAPPTRTPARAQPQRARSHRVRAGESLSRIAARHGVSVGAVQRANGMGSRTLIRPGQVLRIPG
jgi:membrane-bound lytic murein transglycosylase D